MTSTDLNLPCPPLPKLKPREADSHKGTFGNALLIGGSRGMSGAIALAGLAAARTGAGLVRLAIPDRCLETVAAFSPCTMTIPLNDDPQGRLAAAAIEELIPFVRQATCVAIGPGLNQSADLRSLVLKIIREVRCPLVVDADGLNNLASSPTWPQKAGGPLILTPHPGEWSRQVGVAAGDRQGQCQSAIDFAKRFGAVVVLKGHRTLVTDGQTAVLNSTGTPAMATGGSGDVLTGIITALVCQGLSPRDAAHLGIHVHGLAAQLAEQAHQSHVVLPTELIDALPRAFAQLKTT